MPRTQTELFTVIGKMTMSPTGRGHEFTAKSEKYLADQLNQIPLEKVITVTFYEGVPIRSNQQLRYHFVLCGYIAKHMGEDKDTAHDVLMKIVFGVKKVTLVGKTFESRYSLSESGKLTVSQVKELIDEDLKVCQFLEIRVPTAEELGYTPSNVTYNTPVTPFKDDKKK